MNSSKEKGNLVYIPSATYLSKMKEDGTAPKKIVCLKDPKYLLVHEESQSDLAVIMDGEIWHVDKRNVYEVNK